MKIQKCEVCGEETKALHLHMKKHQKSENVKTEEPDPRYATKEDLNRINSSLDKLTAILTESKNPEPAFAIKSVESKETLYEKNPEVSDKSPVPPKWRQTVDEILGPDFGINVVYPDQGNGFLFKIIVPLEKSNADKAYLDMYKVDVRTKSLSYQDGVDGVKRFCELVKRNLQKNTNKLL